jgi:hypothetical protein
MPEKFIFCLPDLRSHSDGARPVVPVSTLLYHLEDFANSKTSVAPNILGNDAFHRQFMGKKRKSESSSSAKKLLSDYAAQKS